MKTLTPSGNDITLQALTAAISAKGVSTFFSQAIAMLMQQSFVAPDKPSIIHSQSIPLIPCSLFMNDLSLSGGTVTQLKATLTSATQKAGGLFTIALNGSFTVSYKNWYEKGGVDCPRPCSTCPNPHHDFENTYGDFWFNVNSVDLSFDVTLAQKDNKWVITVANATQNNVALGTLHVPDNSELNTPSVFGCVNDRISDTMRDTIKAVDFASNMQSALSTFLNTVPTSGKLNDHITFNFPPTLLKFPEDAGISAGITGLVQYDTDHYPGTLVVIPEATMDTSKDLTMNVATYQFNALLWAFNRMNFLNFTLQPAMLPDPQMLNTTYYKKYMPELYNFAPGAYMSVDIKTNADPTVVNDTIYWLTTTVLLSLKGVVPDSTYNTILASSMLSVMYPDKQSFEIALGNTLTAADYSSWAAMIETKSQNIGMKAATGLQLSVNVTKQGISTFAFSFNVTKSDILINYQLAVAGNTQTIKFLFSEYDTDATIVKSSIGNIPVDHLVMLWAVAGLKINEYLQKCGDAGIPLPFIKGFLFRDAVITIQNSYVTLGTNVSFSSLNKLFRGQNGSLTEISPCYNPKEVFHYKQPATAKQLETAEHTPHKL